MAYIIIVCHIVGWGCCGPTIQGLASKAVPVNEQGLVQGVFMAIATASGIVAAPVSAGLFAWFIRPDAPFVFPASRSSSVQRFLRRAAFRAPHAGGRSCRRCISSHCG